MNKLVVSLSTLVIAYSANAFSNPAISTPYKLTQSNEARTKIYNSEQDNTSSPVKSTTIRIENPTQFIVELYDQPVLNFKRKLPTKLSSLNRQQELASLLKQQASKITKQQQSLVQQGITLKAFNKVIRHNSKIHNSLVVESNNSNIALLKDHPLVKRITPVSIVTKQLTESVPQTNADQLWSKVDSNNLPLTGHNIKVAIIDTGIDYTHSDLGGCFGEGCKVVAGYDFVNSDDDPMDDDGHGTHVAGIVAAKGTITGIAPDASLVAVKVLNENGSGTNADIIAGIEYSVDPDNDPTTNDGVDVINMSLGGPGGPEDPLTVAANNAVDAGVTVVVAAGNDGRYGDIYNSSPTSAVKAITVGSITKQNQLSSFTSKGGSADYKSLKPEIVAPGSDINSTYPGGINSQLSGTSMASPHVAGVAALLLQSNSSLTPEQVKAKLVAGATNLDFDAFAQGYGALNALTSYQAEVTLVSSDLSLGRIKSEDNYQYNGSVVIENSSDVAQTYTVNLPQNLPEQVTITTESEEVVLSAGQKTTIIITVTVDDIDSLTTPDNEAAAYFWSIELAPESASESTPTFNIPVIIEKGHQLTITHDNNSSIDVSIDSDNGDMYFWGFIYAGESKTLYLPNKKLLVRVQHELSNDDVSHLDLPDSADGIKREYWGYEEHIVDVNEDTNLHISTANLANLSTIAQLDGNEIDSQAMLNAQALLRSAVSYQEGNFSGTITYRTNKWQDTTASEAMVRRFFILGSQTTEIASTYSSLEKLPVSDSRPVESYVHLVSNLLNSEHQTTNINEADLPFVTITDDTNLQSSEFGAILGTEDKHPIYNISTEQNEIRISQHLVGETKDSLIVAVGVKNESSNNSFSSYAASKKLYFNEAAYSAISPVSEKLISSGEEISFSTSGTSLTKPIEFGNDINIPFYAGDLFTNAQGQKLESGINASYKLNCDGEEVATGNFDSNSHITTNFQECTSTLFKVNWDTALQGKSYQSESSYQFSPESNIVFSGVQLALFEQQVLNTSAVIANPSAYILIKSDDIFSSININSLEYQLDGADWQPLSYSATSEHGFSFSASLPQITSGKPVVSIRIKYSSISNSSDEATQTINGLFIYDSVAATADLDKDGVADVQDNDIDGDGMPNDYEEAQGFNPYDSSDAILDKDLDNLSNLDEYLAGSNPAIADTDGDGVLDGNDVTPAGIKTIIQNDFDGDGISDILYRSDDSLNWRLDLINNFSVKSSITDLTLSNCCGWLFNGIGDFNADGFNDVIIRNVSSGKWYIYNLDGSQVISKGYVPLESAINVGVQAIADFNNDGFSDVLLRNEQTGEWKIALLNNRTVIEELTPPMSTVLGWKIVDTKDFDGNGSADILIRNESSGAWYMYLYDNTNIISRGYVSTLPDDLNVDIYGVGDFDADGKYDLLSRNKETNEWVIWYMNGKELKHSLIAPFSTADSWEFNSVGDYNGDGFTDVAIRNKSSDKVHIYLWDGESVISKDYLDLLLEDDYQAKSLVH